MSRGIPEGALRDHLWCTVEPAGDPQISEVAIRVQICSDDRLLSQEAASLVADEIRRQVATKGMAVMLLDGSPALEECYRKLSEENLPWTQVVAFQLAEWRGLAEEDPRSGRRLLLETLVRRVPMAEFHSLRGEAANPAAVCVNYERLMIRRRPDLAVVAVGGQGEIGTPPVISYTAGGVQSGSRVGWNTASIGVSLGALLECGSVVVIGDSWPAEAGSPGVARFTLRG
ncbi:MAG: hypothetical protein RIR52_981 [Acidobacteriota bacterium]|jgi:hypothetical protein